MQPNVFNKQMKIDMPHRERPLQKSMLLPDSQLHPSSPTSRGNPLQFSVYTPMKKSLVSTPDNTANNTNNIAFNPSNFTFNSNLTNFQQSNTIGSTYQSRISQQSEPNYQSYTLKSLLSPYKNDIKGEQSPEEYPRIYSKYEKSSVVNHEGKMNQSLNNVEAIIQQVINQVKDKHLPNILGKLKKQIYDDIHNIRLQFHSFREQMRSNVKRQDVLLNQIKLSQGNTFNYNNSINNYGGNNKEKVNKQEEVAELQTHYFLLQGKLSQIQAKMSENSKIFLQQFQKLNMKMQFEHKNHGMKASVIKSNLSPIMIEYKQSFCVHKVINNLKSREQEIIINHCMYFIDKFGYLMDNEHRYLIDGQGAQIRLDEKHMRILESHKILQK